jgi:hypothetical protein
MFRSALTGFAIAMVANISYAQTVPAIQTDPPVTQIRKAVTFISLSCTKGTERFTAKGTGFFVGYPVPGHPDLVFPYLVTNRHVALCLDDSGRAMQVQSISIRMNRKTSENGNFSEDLVLNEHGNVQWVTPSDFSIDLAAFRITSPPNPDTYDFKWLPLKMLATSDLLVKNQVTEGESVLFAGFFQQFPGNKRMEPIVRRGIIAMMPEEKIPFVGTPEKVYLADLHVFHGNSGSPAFINLGGYRNGSLMVGEDYHLLGVVNAYVVEDEHLNLKLERQIVTAVGHSGGRRLSVAGTGQANSGIATIVPADEVKAILDLATPH